jgi:carbon-monoxide dehydrogenase medium subunit
MKAASFDYIAPRSLEEAAAALGSDQVSAIAIAGGQSLVPMLNLRVSMPDLLVNLTGLRELKEISQDQAGIRVGALVTHADVEDGKTPDLFNGLMRKVASGISYRAVRNYGTIGGSVALADPSADWPSCLTALGANVLITDGDQTRAEPIADFIRGQYATSLAKSEIVVGLAIPRPEAGLRWGFCKVARKSGAFANSIAVALEQGRGGPAAIVLGAAAPRPCLLRATSERAGDRAASDDDLRNAIIRDLKDLALDADAYLMRLHLSTVIRAIGEMRRK